MSRLLIASPNNISFSETFIRNQTKNLNPDFLITGGWYPFKTKTGSIFQGYLRINLIRGIIKKLFFSFYKRKYDYYLSQYIVKNEITHALIHYGVTAAHMNEALKLTNCKYTVHFHGFDAYYHQTIKDYHVHYLNMFKDCNKIVSVSKDMRNKLISLGAPIEKLFLQPYGADISLFKPGNTVVMNVNTLLFVGRLTPKKSPILLLKAFKLVLEKFPTVTLKIIGSGELLNSVKDFIVQNNLEKNVKLMGVLEPNEVKTELQNCDLFVQHSVHADNGDSEGTPNSIIEAAACGKAIVSTFHAGIKEAVIDKITGLLVEERDFESMAEKIIYLIENPNICQKMGEAGREHILKNYNLDFSTKSLHEIIFS